MIKVSRNFFLAILSLTLAGVCIAQDTHYWTLQYGSRSSLLGGAVVGGVRDNSAVYYNPGALVLSDTSAISVSANAYQFDQLKMDNGAGTNINLKSGQTQIIPLIISI